MREFVDAVGVRWSVWEARHGSAAASVRGPSGEEQQGGWLVFASPAGRWRVYPVPPAWEFLDDEELDALRRRKGVPARVPGRPFE